MCNEGPLEKKLSRNRFLLHDPETGVTIVATDEAFSRRADVTCVICSIGVEMFTVIEH